MKPGSCRLLLFAASALLGSTIFAVEARPQDAPAPPGPTESLPDDPTTPLFQATCIKCHDQARVLAVRRTKTEWEEIVRKMIERGATGTGRDFETVYDYLVRHFGKVYINTDGREDLCGILGLDEKSADAIIAHRDSNGAFADLDAIKKVTGVDAKKIDAMRDAIAF
jgi:competence ComEA-like helix-hairpin-helix protein